MARNSEDRSLFLRNLAEYPYIYYAAKKSGINPSTIYRWMGSNPDFAKEVRALLRTGLANQNQKIEMVLVKKALGGDLGAIKFYLPHNSKKYRPMRSDFPPPPITAEEREMFRAVYEWTLKNKPIPTDIRETMIHAFRANGHIDADGKLSQKFHDTFNYLLKDWGAERSKRKYG